MRVRVKTLYKKSTFPLIIEVSKPLSVKGKVIYMAKKAIVF